MKRMYYYPTSTIIGNIMYERMIKLPTKGIMGFCYRCIWLTSNPEYYLPPDVIHMDREGYHNTTIIKIIPSRIILLEKQRLKNWHQYKIIAKIPEDIVFYIENYAENNGIDLKEWHFSVRPISMDNFWSIEYWRGGAFTELK